MSRDPTRHLIERLSTNLAPVQPVAPLASTLAALMGVALLVGGAVLAVYHPKPALWTTFVGDPTYASVLVGLSLAVVGGCLGTLASVIPGREAVMRVGVAAAVVGLLLAVGGAAATTPWSEVALSSEFPGHGMCIVRGVGFAIVPGFAAFYAATRGWSGRPEITVVLALLGTGAVGALLVHLTCPAIDPFHVLCTHTSTPLLLTAVLTAALLPLVRRYAR